MAYQFYLAIKGKKQGQFKGDAARPPEGNWIVGLGFSYEITSPRDPATGQASGKRQHQPLTIIGPWGASSPQIYQALVTNEDLESVDLEFVRTDKEGKEYVFYTIKLTDATIFDFRQYIDAAAAQPQPLESVSFTFRRIEEESKDGKTSVTDDWQA